MPLTEQELAPGLAAFLSTVEVNAADNMVAFPGHTAQATDTRQLRLELATALYEKLHAGITHSDDVAKSPRRDRDFEQLLTAGLPHATSLVNVVLKDREVAGTDGHSLVEINHTLVLVPPGVLPDECRNGDQLTVPLPAVRPALSPGFLLVDGSSGAPKGHGDVLRLYLHIASPEAAPEIWSAAVEVLEQCRTRYRAKVLSRPDGFPRRDSIVIYLAEGTWPNADAVATALAGHPGLAPDTSPLTIKIAPGIAMAWEPRDPRAGWERMSFGQHRTALLAVGLVQHMTDDVPLEQAVRDALTDGMADPAEPAMNLGSPDFRVRIDK